MLERTSSFGGGESADVVPLEPTSNAMMNESKSIYVLLLVLTEQSMTYRLCS